MSAHDSRQRQYVVNVSLTNRSRSKHVSCIIQRYSPFAAQLSLQRGGGVVGGVSKAVGFRVLGWGCGVRGVRLGVWGFLTYGLSVSTQTSAG